MAGGAIDLDEITTPEIFDPVQVKGCILVSVFYECPAGLVNKRSRLIHAPSPHDELGASCRPSQPR
jgi:hypothetical protein